MYRDEFSQFHIRWIYYYDSNVSTGKETGKMHLCICDIQIRLRKGMPQLPYKPSRSESQVKGLSFFYVVLLMDSFRKRNGFAEC